MVQQTSLKLSAKFAQQLSSIVPVQPQPQAHISNLHNQIKIIEIERQYSKLNHIARNMNRYTPTSLQSCAPSLCLFPQECSAEHSTNFIHHGQ